MHAQELRDMDSDTLLAPTEKDDLRGPSLACSFWTWTYWLIWQKSILKCYPYIPGVKGQGC